MNYSELNDFLLENIDINLVGDILITSIAFLTKNLDLNFKELFGDISYISLKKEINIHKSIIEIISKLVDNDVPFQIIIQTSISISISYSSLSKNLYYGVKKMPTIDFLDNELKSKFMIERKKLYMIMESI